MRMTRCGDHETVVPAIIGMVARKLDLPALHVRSLCPKPDHWPGLERLRGVSSSKAATDGSAPVRCILNDGCRPGGLRSGVVTSDAGESTYAKTRALKMCEGKTNAADPRDLFPQADEVRPCANPQCGRLFRPRSKYHPHQLYCGCDECNRSRHCQRQWKYRHPRLHERRGTPPAPGGSSAAVSLRLLWLFIGLLAARKNLVNPIPLPPVVLKHWKRTQGASSLSTEPRQVPSFLWAYVPMQGGEEMARLLILHPA